MHSSIATQPITNSITLQEVYCQIICMIDPCSNPCCKASCYGVLQDACPRIFNVLQDVLDQGPSEKHVATSPQLRAHLDACSIRFAHPKGDTFHQRICGNKSKRCCSNNFAEVIELQKNSKPKKQLHTEQSCTHILTPVAGL